MHPRKRRYKRSIDHHPGMPALSAPFDHPDDAARYAHERIGNRRDREYGGFILVRKDGKYIATEPMNGSEFSFDPNEVFPRNDQKVTCSTRKGMTTMRSTILIRHCRPGWTSGRRVKRSLTRTVFQSATFMR